MDQSKFIVKTSEGYVLSYPNWDNGFDNGNRFTSVRGDAFPYEKKDAEDIAYLSGGEIIPL
jgi:hypothetical protein